MSTYTATDFDTTDCFQVYDQNELDFVCSHYQDIAPKVGVANPGNYSLNAAVTDFTIISFSMLVFGPMLLSFFKLSFPNLFKLMKRNLSSPRTLTVVRGVPGVGKRHYVYDQERNKDGRFAICDWNDFYRDEDGNHTFDGSQISRAEHHSRMRFMDFLDRDVERIYVLGYFNETWTYSDYVRLAEMNGYDVKVVELKCLDVDHLRHFNKRSQHKVPFSKSKKCFDNWEVDPDSVYQEPYLESFPGDCIPKYGTVTKEELDKEMDVYNLRRREVKKMKQEDKYEQSDSEYDPDEDTGDYTEDSGVEDNDDFEQEETPDYTDVVVEYIDDDTIELVQAREVFE